MNYSKKYFEEFPEAGSQPTELEHKVYDFMGMADVSIPFGDEKTVLDGTGDIIKEARPLRWHMKKVKILEREITAAEIEAYNTSKPTVSNAFFGPIINAYDAKFQNRAAVEARLQLPGWAKPKQVPSLFISSPIGADGNPNYELARGRYVLVTKNRKAGQIRPVLNGDVVMEGYCFEQLVDELQVAPGVFTSEGKTAHIVANHPETFALEQMIGEKEVTLQLKKLEARAEGLEAISNSKQYGFVTDIAAIAKQLGMVKLSADQISVPA